VQSLAQLCKWIQQYIYNSLIINFIIIYVLMMLSLTHAMNDCVLVNSELERI
jgi:hypothetical protein